eukprot:m.76884 g.76884  ORF g.76884 m.76884 type:complete len:303 (+) comp7894_c0_seq6:326-1234(+)
MSSSRQRIRRRTDGRRSRALHRWAGSAPHWLPSEYPRCQQSLRAHRKIHVQSSNYPKEISGNGLSGWAARAGQFGALGQQLSGWATGRQAYAEGGHRVRGGRAGPVQGKIALGKADLPDRRRRNHEVAGRAQAVEQRPGDRDPAARADEIRNRWRIAPVLHKLRRQLDRIPLNPIDACHPRPVDPRQHVLQSVPKLMEESLHLAEAHTGRGRGLIAHEVRNGQLAVIAVAGKMSAAIKARVHPCAALLVLWPTVGVQIERRNRSCLVAHLVIRHVGVPDARRRGPLLEPHSEESRRQFKKPG